MSDFLMGFIQNPVDLIILLIIIYFMARGAERFHNFCPKRLL
jgi:hypothetical protein